MDNKYMAMYIDNDGLPRVYAVSDDLELAKKVASEMLDQYIESKPYYLEREDFTLQLIGE